jgi:hypothetical protein
MIALLLSRHRPAVAAFLLALACAGCGDPANTPSTPALAEPTVVEPAAPPAMTPAEDRGKQSADGTSAAEAEQGAFSHVDAGDAERAASRRGHDSAGEPAPGDAPRGGG